MQRIANVKPVVIENQFDAPMRIVLANGDDDTIMGGPEAVFVTVPAANAKVKIADSIAAEAEIKTVTSTAKETVFKIEVAYELEDGYNGVKLEFSGKNFQARLDLSLDVG